VSPPFTHNSPLTIAPPNFGISAEILDNPTKAVVLIWLVSVLLIFHRALGAVSSGDYGTLWLHRAALLARIGRQKRVDLTERGSANNSNPNRVLRNWISGIFIED
jgi:hypothetical protein